MFIRGSSGRAYSVSNPALGVSVGWETKRIGYEPVVTAYAISVSSTEFVLYDSQQSNVLIVVSTE